MTRSQDTETSQDLRISDRETFEQWGPPREHLNVLASGTVLLIQINRPTKLNALCDQLMEELALTLREADKTDDIACVILCGNKKAFAAGGDLLELLARSHSGAYLENYISSTWDSVQDFRKPLIAAVAGHAIGGGCELALCCDFILAADNARFSVPEVLVGTVSATQRLPRILGKSKAMEMIMTGRPMLADEAERCGVVSRVLPPDDLLDDAVATARKIAALSRPVVMLAKECVNFSYEAGLRDGVRFERKVFLSTLSFNDCKEGLSAVLEKRQPNFQNC